jgi:hypothetical protein
MVFSIQRDKSTDGTPSGSVFDRAKNTPDKTDFIVVPAGQEINVEVVSRENSAPTSEIKQRKVVLPVRVGFSTAIEVFTKVHLRFVRDTDYGRVYTLASVKIGKKTYKTETDAIPAGLEMRFTLIRPLRIRRD